LVLPPEVAHPFIPIAKLTQLSSPSSILPEALSEALGVSVLDIMKLYYHESDNVGRGRLIGNALDRKRMGEEDQEWLDRESKHREEAEVSSYWEDSAFLSSKGFVMKEIWSVKSVSVSTRAMTGL
jgi:hypothetical protein